MLYERKETKSDTAKFNGKNLAYEEYKDNKTGDKAQYFFDTNNKLVGIKSFNTSAEIIFLNLIKKSQATYLTYLQQVTR